MCAALFAEAARGLSTAAAIHPHQAPALLTALALVLRPCLRQRRSAKLLLRFLPELLPLTLDAIDASNPLKTICAFTLVTAIADWLPVVRERGAESGSASASVGGGGEGAPPLTLVFGLDAEGVAGSSSADVAEAEEEDDDDDDDAGWAI